MGFNKWMKFYWNVSGLGRKIESVIIEICQCYKEIQENSKLLI